MRLGQAGYTRCAGCVSAGSTAKQELGISSQDFTCIL